MNTEITDIWPRIQARLVGAVDHSVYRVWLEPLSPLELDGDRLVIGAPARLAPWVAERFRTILASSASEVLGRSVEIEVVATATTGDGRPPRLRGAHPPAPRGGSRSDRPSHDAGDSASSVVAPNPKLTFEQFVIGDCNRLAHAAALAVAEMPAQTFNPLFIFGRPGLGKTHLLHSIATYVRTYGGGLTVRHTTGEAFTAEFLLALRSGDVEAFKARFRHVDALLVDDVQFLERKTRTEEEFFHTFNVLTDMGSQVVLTSDRPPRDLEALEDRLRERFQSGLVAEIAPPDVDTRVAILRKRVACDGIPVADAAALEHIALAAPDNVRALEGALIRVVAFASLSGRQLTADLARQAIGGLYAAAPCAPRTLAQICDAAGEHFKLTAQTLVSADRRPKVAWPRHVAMYLSRELTSESLPAIGRYFGGRDHSTVLHACRRTAHRMANDEQARTDVAALLEHLRPHPDRPT